MSRILRCLSWNIDGLDDRMQIERLAEVIKVIRRKVPHVIMLQEVVPVHLPMLRQQLPNYNLIYNEKGDYPYFCLIGIHGLEVNEYVEVPFPNSIMCRHAIAVSASYENMNMLFVTSHLESLKQGSKARIEQMKVMINTIYARSGAILRHKLPSDFPKGTINGEHSFALFGADTNLREKEIPNPLPPGVVDVWEALGRKKATEFTWDLKRNDNVQAPFMARCRYDRFWYNTEVSSPQPFTEVVDLTGDSPTSETIPSTTSGRRWKPYLFELTGLERIPSAGRLFPSDHFGIYSEFIYE